MWIPMIPMIPTWNEKPPTLYSILESIVNFDKEEQTKIKDLAKIGRSTIFNFNYPLTPKIKKEDFECMILNKFIMRRIGFETVTAFRIQLNVKLNEIMPTYNKMFDMLDGWDLFTDGEVTERDVITTNESSNDSVNSTTNVTTNTLTNSSNTSGNNISDSRNSEMPQSKITEVQNAEYLDNYQYKTDTNSSEDNSNSSGSSNSKVDGINNTVSNSEDKTKEITKRTPADKLRIYQDFITNKTNIYTMIFKDLEDLFYQLV